MTKEEKLYLSFFIISIFSLLAAFILKIFGIDWFYITFTYDIPIHISYIINTTMLLIQFYLIIGSIVKLNPKSLFFKLLPYMPLNLLLYFFPHNHFLILSFLLLFVTAISISPKFSTITSFVFNIFIISSIQLFLIWLKLGIFDVVFPSLINIILINIDQFILLGLLYYINRKWGDKYAKLVIYRRKK